MPLPCGTKFLQVLIFAIFSAVRKNKFPQTGITAKIYSRGNTVFSNLNWRTLSIVWKYVFLLHATKILSMLGTGYFLNRKSQKLIPSKRNQSFLIAKICSRKTQKIANAQKQTPAKISCHTVSVGKMIGRLINQGRAVFCCSLRQFKFIRLSL